MPRVDHRLSSDGSGFRRSPVHGNGQLHGSALDGHAADGRLGSLPKQCANRQRNGFRYRTRSVRERRHRRLHGIRLRYDELQRYHRLRRRLYGPRHCAAHLPVRRSCAAAGRLAPSGRPHRHHLGYLFLCPAAIYDEESDGRFPASGPPTVISPSSSAESVRSSQRVCRRAGASCAYKGRHSQWTHLETRLNPQW
jgi:hypothetical protein